MAVDQSSLDLIATIQKYGGRVQRVASTEGGEWKGPCPKCGGTDRFTVQPEYGSNGGRWSCRQCSPQWGDTVGFVQFVNDIGFVDACKELSIQLEFKSDGNKATPPVDLAKAPESAPPKPSKRIYQDLADYARKHGVEPHVFTAWGWKDGTHNNRPCIFIPGHDDGIDRIRFVDKPKAEFRPVKEGRRRCLYGWERALAMTGEGRALVLCNGQPSVVMAQHYNIPAIAQTDGENALEPHTLDQLVAELKNGRKLIIALDGDEPGRKATEKIKAQLMAYDVAVVDFGGVAGYDLGDFAAQHKDKTYAMLQALMRTSKQEAVQVNDLGAMSQGLDDFLDHDVCDDSGILSPFKSFHNLGGFAFIMPTGFMTAIVAMSGGGKTTFQETMAQHWLKTDHDILWYSPEWGHQALYWRMIQRNGGATTDQLRAHALYLSDLKSNRWPNSGTPIDRTSPAYAKTRIINRQIREWPGNLHCFKEVKFTEDILNRMRDRLHLLRRDGRRVPVAFFDYLQLMRTKEETPNRTAYENMINLIKSWSSDHAIHSIVGVQIPMATGRMKNHVLGKYDMHYCPPNVFNLIVTLNILEDETGKTNRAIVNIAKNNEGQEGRIPMTTNFRYLAWEDKPWAMNEHS